MKTVLVTGGAGFVGSHVVNHLQGKNYNVVVVDNLSSGQIDNIPDGTAFYPFDIVSSNLKVVFEKHRPEVVIHLAAQSHVGVSMENRKKDAQVNVMGTINLLDWCKVYKVQHVIFSSTAAVYGDQEQLPIKEEAPHNPLSPYALSKLTAEKYIQLYAGLYGFNYTVLRFSNVYGPRQANAAESGVITKFAERLLTNQSPIVYGDGTQTRDFIFVKDVADGIVSVLQNESGGIFNLSTASETSINEVLSTMYELIGRRIEPTYLPFRKGDIYRSCLSNSKAVQALGWTPKTSLHAGIKETLQYFREKLD
ncbi:NAD-dependent epimerase/dehydratase [Caldalkalibacillus thermarum TA2.A1]|uniref:GDP-mannose 4,6-dehydratase n=1 Tax=Caldalkalibacillus thermarum (strain TA2.A1) TaxID=986075 RepID=F5L993_CALTT|nr:NAD-dependent epimerase/dehydratase family protein [Caldalkalibacillus thermarum]EGL82035.1 NAD-dependent epimerase/dehydratase [Caldalkalibacillus thermarum TA2.A1]QZT34046.1 GDP-mannose 4,6-dehydratase [Caldalkalibacillus thermarum TA2.A1]